MDFYMTVLISHGVNKDIYFTVWDFKFPYETARNVTSLFLSNFCLMLFSLDNCTYSVQKVCHN